MIGTIFKTFGFFFLFFLIFSIPVGGRPLFSHLFEKSGPLGQVLVHQGKNIGKITWEKGKEIGGALFSNSEPKVKGKKLQSSAEETGGGSSHTSLPSDTYRPEDTRELENIIEGAQN